MTEPAPAIGSAAAAQLVVVCGLSGAGKTSATDELEDHGFFCVDNVPEPLLQPLVEFAQASGGQLRRLALAVTVQSHAESLALVHTLAQLSASGSQVALLFLDASHEVLVRRFSETRRRHPFDATGHDLPGAIRRERELLQPLRTAAQHVIDSTGLRARELRQRVVARVGLDADGGPLVEILSFGFKYGVPRDAQLLFDARFLPNPYFVPELRDRSGEDAEVARYALDCAEARTFLAHMEGLCDVLLNGALAGGASLQLAVGCTGGRHRSVALACELGRRLEARGNRVRLHHRDSLR